MLFVNCECLLFVKLAFTFKATRKTFLSNKRMCHLVDFLEEKKEGGLPFLGLKGECRISLILKNQRLNQRKSMN